LSYDCTSSDDTTNSQEIEDGEELDFQFMDDARRVAGALLAVRSGGAELGGAAVDDRRAGADEEDRVREEGLSVALRA
jgi:hypothetical protein